MQKVVPGDQSWDKILPTIIFHVNTTLGTVIHVAIVDGMIQSSKLSLWMVEKCGVNVIIACCWAMCPAVFSWAPKTTESASGNSGASLMQTMPWRGPCFIMLVLPSRWDRATPDPCWLLKMAWYRHVAVGKQNAYEKPLKRLKWHLLNCSCGCYARYAVELFVFHGSMVLQRFTILGASLDLEVLHFHDSNVGNTSNPDRGCRNNIAMVPQCSLWKFHPFRKSFISETICIF